MATGKYIIQMHSPCETHLVKANVYFTHGLSQNYTSFSTLLHSSQGFRRLFYNFVDHHHFRPLYHDGSIWKLLGLTEILKMMVQSCRNKHPNPTAQQMAPTKYAENSKQHCHHLLIIKVHFTFMRFSFLHWKSSLWHTVQGVLIKTCYLWNSLNVGNHKID